MSEKFYKDRLALRPAVNPRGATMATKSKPAVTHTWTVTIDGSPVTVTAEDFDMNEQGALVFLSHGATVRMVAPGHWNTVELVVPADPAEMASPPV